MKSFRNASVFILDKNQSIGASFSSIKSFSWIPSEARSDFSIGFLPLNDGSIIKNSEKFLYGIIRIEKKTPPRSLVNELVNKRVVAIRQSGRSVSRDERSSLRDDVIRGLIPKTLPSYSNIQFIVSSENVEAPSSSGSNPYVVFDRAIGADVNECIGLLVSSSIFNCQYRAMIPHKFYDNLVEHLLKGSSFYKDFEIGDLFDIFSEASGLYESKRSKEGASLEGSESVDAINVKTKGVGFTIKSNGVLKKLHFDNKKLSFDAQAEIILNVICKLEKEQ